MASAFDRVVGQYPLSIATSLALEGLYGTIQDGPINKLKPKDFKEIWFNLRTLFRNFYNAIGKDDYPSISKKELQRAFKEEIDNLKNVISQLSPDLKVTIYHSEYRDLHRHFPKAVQRTDTTDNQVHYTKAMREMINHVLEQDDSVVKIQLFIAEIKSKALMLTHLPIDLFAYRHDGIALLESHTGVIKTKDLFNTKYLNGKTLSQMPFRLDFLTIFGDSDMFKPNLMPYRKALIELSEKYSWSTLTSTDKIKYCIGTLTDKYLALNLKELIGTR